MPRSPELNSLNNQFLVAYSEGFISRLHWVWLWAIRGVIACLYFRKCGPYIKRHLQNFLTKSGSFSLFWEFPISKVGAAISAIPAILDFIHGNIAPRIAGIAGIARIAGVATPNLRLQNPI